MWVKIDEKKVDTKVNRWNTIAERWPTVKEKYCSESIKAADCQKCNFETVKDYGVKLLPYENAQVYQRPRILEGLDTKNNIAVFDQT